MLVFGTRPEAIKMAPIIKALQKKTKDFRSLVCVSGQHREMLDQVLMVFDIIPDFDLNIMHKGQDLYDVTTKVLNGMKLILEEERPDLLLVHGDTTTSMAAALAAYYQQIPVAHVEAGLRTYNIYSPFPEEINRQLTGRIASYHFAPTPTSRNNLLKENVHDENILVTGNTVIDALILSINKIKSDPNLAKRLQNELLNAGYNINRLSHGKKLVLITGHRRENFGDGFINICKAIKHLSHKYSDIDFVYPMHLNPNVRKAVSDVFGNDRNIENLFFIEPLEYLSFIFIMEKSYLVMTDSGGIQEEAPSLGKPVLVMRDTTERPEAVEAGTVKLVGANFKNIVDTASSLIENEQEYLRMAQATNPYGDGNASERIISFISNLYDKNMLHYE